MRHFSDGRELQYFEKNIIRYEEGKLFLPHCATDGSIVEIILMDQNTYRVDGRGVPIRFHKNIGNEVLIGSRQNNSDMCPRFIFDGVRKEWILDCHGYVCFPEIEINYQKEEE